MTLQGGLLGMVVGLGIAEAKPELLTQIGATLRPVTKALIQAGFTLVDTLQELAAEGMEHLNDLVAEVQYERSAAAPAEDEQKKAV